MDYKKYKFLLNKNMIVLMITTLIIHLSTYLVIPILPIFLEKTKGLDPLKISIIISSNFIAAQIGSIIGGILCDKVNIKLTIILGAIIQALTIFIYTLSNIYFFFIIIAIISGIGHGMNAPSIKDAINKLTTKGSDEQSYSFSIRGIAANTGLCIAGAVILIISSNQHHFIFYISSILYGITAIVTLFYASKEAKEQKSKLYFKDYKQILSNKRFIYFGIAIFIINIAYSQLQFILPLKFVTKITNSSMVGLIWTIISIEVIFMQALIHKMVIKKIHSYSTLFIAMLFFSSGILIIGFANNFIIFLVSALIFTIGQMLITPTIDSEVSKLAQDKISGFYFSVSNLLTGLGSAVGTYGSGLIINYYGINGSLTPYLIISISLVVLSLLILFVKKLCSKLEQNIT
jgi:MFS family permease